MASSKSFPCPKCKGYTYVYHGRSVKGRIPIERNKEFRSISDEPQFVLNKDEENLRPYHRYRKCSACGHTYQTLETYFREDARKKVPV